MTTARPSLPAAERVRLSRKRRREGTHYVRVQLDRPDIDGLIRLRLLRQSERNSNAALQVAVRAVSVQVVTVTRMDPRFG
jgi:hypothetical protein